MLYNKTILYINNNCSDDESDENGRDRKKSRLLPTPPEAKHDADIPPKAELKKLILNGPYYLEIACIFNLCE